MSKDIVGKIFGKLTVIERAGLDRTRKNSTWLCLCTCGNKKIVSRNNLIQCKTQSCGCIVSLPIEDYKKEQERRFWKFVEKTDDCWIWRGSLDKEGYGCFNYRSKTIKAHRYSFELYNNRRIANGSFICHKCDNPSCVNPDHIYEGTHKDNMNDLRDRKRWGKKRKNYSELQKRAIKILLENSFSFREIAELLKISASGVLRHENN